MRTLPTNTVGGTRFSARSSGSARTGRRPVSTPLHRLHPRFERLEPRTSPLQHPALRIELFTSDEIELPEVRTQHRAKITLEIALGRAQRRRQVVHESAGDLIDPERLHRNSSK